MINKSLSLLLAGMILLLPLQLVASPVVKGVRVAADGERSRIVIELTQPASYRYFILSNPNRVVLDFADTLLRVAPKIDPDNVPGLLRVRTGRRAGGTLRVVLDLEPGVRAEQFSLSTTGGDRGRRVIVDLYFQPKSASEQRMAASEASLGVKAATGASVSEQRKSPRQAPIKTESQLEQTTQSDPVRSEPEPLTGTRGGEWSGYVAGEYRYFTQSTLDTRQHNGYGSIAFEPEYYYEWDDGYQSITFRPFFRLDQYDDQRTHADIRELMWIKAADDWELRLGVGKVFWGVTEAVHLVDIINQTDLVENVDGEQKLGQPMAQFSIVRDWGVLDLFALPYFRERTFPGDEGRPRTQPRVDVDNPLYESAAEQTHFDLSARWSQTFGDWDVGVAYFRGTSREPRFIPGVTDLGEPVLVPYYDIIDQGSLDLQATLGNWLWKLESIYRSGQNEPFAAAAGGFEYTLVGVGGSQSDLGILAEYLWDERGVRSASPLQDDLFLGVRWVANDVQSTEVLAGVISDLGYGSRLFNVEASRRFGEDWVMSLQMRLWDDVDDQDPTYALRNDDYIELLFQRYF